MGNPNSKLAARVTHRVSGGTSRWIGERTFSVHVALTRYLLELWSSVSAERSHPLTEHEVTSRVWAREHS